MPVANWPTECRKAPLPGIDDVAVRDGSVLLSVSADPPFLELRRGRSRTMLSTEVPDATGMPVALDPASIELSDGGAFFVAVPPDGSPGYRVYEATPSSATVLFGEGDATVDGLVRFDTRNIDAAPRVSAIDARVVFAAELSGGAVRNALVEAQLTPP